MKISKQEWTIASVAALIIASLASIAFFHAEDSEPPPYWARLERSFLEAGQVVRVVCQPGGLPEGRRIVVGTRVRVVKHHAHDSDDLEPFTLVDVEILEGPLEGQTRTWDRGCLKTE